MMHPSQHPAASDYDRWLTDTMAGGVTIDDHDAAMRAVDPHGTAPVWVDTPDGPDADAPPPHIGDTDEAPMEWT
jgi:hypothetical protein